MSEGVGEFAAIDAIARVFGPLAALEGDGALPLGDDAAALPCEARGRLVVTVDAAFEGVHFDRAWLRIEELAERATEAALSDLAAMGATAAYAPGRPTGLLCAWSVPPGFARADLEALAAGVARSAQRAQTRVLGGNLSRGPALSLTTTALGWLDAGAPALTRGGARVGDILCLTGPVGAAALGLRALQRGLAGAPALEPFVRAWRAPRARLALAGALRSVCTAAIDLSDGLAQDAGHVARASGVALELDAGALPLAPGAHEAAALVGGDAREAALYGGEDYELLCALPEAALAALPALRPVGRVVAGAGVWLCEGASRSPLAPRGWDHLRGA